MKSAGTLKVSKKISAAFSRFFRGLSGASDSRTGCCNKIPCRYPTKTPAFPRMLPVRLPFYYMSVPLRNVYAALWRISAAKPSPCPPSLRLQRYFESIKLPSQALLFIPHPPRSETSIKSGTPIPCSIGCASFINPLNRSISFPTKYSPSKPPAMTRVCL